MQNTIIKSIVSLGLSCLSLSVLAAAVPQISEAGLAGRCSSAARRQKPVLRLSRNSDQDSVNTRCS